MASLGGLNVGSPGRFGPRPVSTPRPLTYKPQGFSLGRGPSLGGLTGPQKAVAPKVPKPPGATKVTVSAPAPAGSTPSPTAAGGAGSTPGPGAPSPYDATYYLDLAAATNKANQQINTYNSDIANAGTALNGTLAQLRYNQGLATTKDQNAENARGGFAQGALGQQLGQLNRAYLDTSSADQLKFSQDSAAWNSAIAGVQQGLSIEQIALAAASAARQAALTSKGAVSNPGAAGTPGTAPAAAPAATSAGAPGSAPQPTGVVNQGRSSRGGKATGFARRAGQGGFVGYRPGGF